VSRRNQFNRRKHQNSVPILTNGVIWIIVGGIVILAAIFMFVQGNNSGQPGKTVQQTVVGSARISVDQEVKDYGTVRFNTPVEAVFEIGNVGDRDLIFLGQPRVELVEGC
jgi:hypothetical protein